MEWWVYCLIFFAVGALDFFAIRTVIRDEREERARKENEEHMRRVCKHFDRGDCVHRQEGVTVLMQPCSRGCCNCNKDTRIELEKCRHG